LRRNILENRKLRFAFLCAVHFVEVLQWNLRPLCLPECNNFGHKQRCE